MDERTLEICVLKKYIFAPMWCANKQSILKDKYIYIHIYKYMYTNINTNMYTREYTFVYILCKDDLY